VRKVVRRGRAEAVGYAHLGSTVLVITDGYLLDEEPHKFAPLCLPPGVAFVLCERDHGAFLESGVYDGRDRPLDDLAALQRNLVDT
jgi:hypothetical protein